MSKSEYAPLLSRLAIGIFFVVMGINKLKNPDMIIDMLGSLGLVAPIILGWVLILSEIVFGAALVVGYRVKYAVWPLAAIIIVALFLVAIPSGQQPNIFWHILGLAVLVSLYLTGSGKHTWKH
jgi:putative oxidoreductase